MPRDEAVNDKTNFFHQRFICIIVSDSIGKEDQRDRTLNRASLANPTNVEEEVVVGREEGSAADPPALLPPSGAPDPNFFHHRFVRIAETVDI